METKRAIGISLMQDSEIDEVLSFYNSIYNTDRSREKFLWEFFNAPAGRAIYVVAKDLEKQRIIGTQCAIPIELLGLNGQTILSAKSEDTLVDPEYRGLNIFDNMYALLFTECRKANIKYIWGFTSAKKPFLKLGFEIPFDHSQSLIVIGIIASYKYLSQLNRQNTTIALIKIFGLCVLSRIKGFEKQLLASKRLLSHYSYQINSKQHVYDNSELLREEKSTGFIIKQDEKFLRWRVADNPYYKEVFQISFSYYSKIVARIIFNHHEGGVWYLVNDMYSDKITESQKSTILMRSMKELCKQRRSPVKLIRTWDFAHNSYGKKEIDIRKNSGFIHLNKGISFVWKRLDEKDTLDVKEFILSRFASQGVN